jgi:DNA (cytosine-5)-methyltransferase 1
MTKQRSGSSGTRITAVDLFCGVGGLTHGLTMGGVTVAAGVDIDPGCQYPYEANNAALFLKRDVNQLQASEVNDFYAGADVSLLAGCAPCQPFSSYSRSGRNSDYATQWPLVLDFGRLVEEVKPDLVTMENVPQLVEHPVFQQFLKSLRGYKKWWSIVECSSLGIPQTRRRLVLMASRLGSAKLRLKAIDKSSTTVRQSIGDLVPIRAGERDPSDALHSAPALSYINMQRIQASRPGGSWRDWPEELHAECHRKTSGATYPSVYGRMEWDKPGPTITTQCFGYGNGRFGHPEQDRAISLREAAILQTFPPSYRFAPDDAKIKFSRMGRLIGNAVPVRLGEVISRSLIDHVEAYRS